MCGSSALRLRRRLVFSLPLFLPTFLFGTSNGAAAAEVATEFFAECEEAFLARPETSESTFCYFEVARKTGRWTAAAERLEELLADHPENFWLHLTSGHLQGRQSPERAEELYRIAAEGFSRSENSEGEVVARDNLRRLLFGQGRIEEAGAEIERALEVAAGSADPIVEARALTLQAQHLYALGHVTETLYRLLRRAELAMFPEGPYALQRSCLMLLGATSLQLGRYDEANSTLQRLQALAEEKGDTFAATSVRYNIANTRLAEMVELPKAGGRDELITLFRQALEAAQVGGYRSVEVQSHRLLGNVLSASAKSRDQAEHHFTQCLEGARQLQRPRLEAICLRALGTHRVRWRSPTAWKVLDEAESLARENEDLLALGQIEEQRMRSLWDTVPQQSAVAGSLAALQTIEALRARQHAESGRAGLFSLLTDPYYWLAGRLLESEEGSSRQNQEQAFQLAELLRARVLLEALDTSGAAAIGLRQGELAEARNNLVDVQRRLLAPDLEKSKRQRLLLDLEQLEWTEAETLTAHIEAAEPEFTSLEEIEASLATNEALLTFQVALWEDIYGDFAGGAWLFVVTHEGSRVYRLPDRTRLRPAIRVFRGLVERRDGSEAPAAAALYRDLLAPALAELPPGIERLVLVPDDHLHLLPWGLLAESSEAPSLAERFHLSLAPSATLWQRFRERAEPIQGAVLAFADPQLPGASVASKAAAERTWALASGARLGALPHARREGRAAVRLLGGSSHLLVGPEATEHTLKDMDLTPFGLLHFATHAVVDEQHAQRSAVLLAPGDSTEDGLLQPRDIVGLDLTGKAVVLSACQSASGEVLRGEGVLSLARPFFQAGANAVVGSLWPLRDDEAARLFEAFYRHLARGKSLEAALAAAQGDLIAEGAPAAAWSGLAVFGDGSLVPVPGGRSRFGWWIGFSGILLVIVLGLRIWRRA